MASGRQYTLSVALRMQGQTPARQALDSLSSGLKDVRESAKQAGGSVSDAAKKATGATSSWRGLGRASGGGASVMASVARRVGSMIRAGILLPFKAATLAAGVLKTAMVGAAGLIVGAWLQVKGAMAALRPAAEMEQYSIQLEVLTKSATVARRRLAELKEYARTTNFSPKEVIEASNLMQAFGLWTEKGMRRLKAAGDAANAFGKDIREVVTAMNYLSSGRSGEAFEALSRIGVTRQALKPMGLEFKKSGELVTEPKKAVDIVFSYLEKQFGGMTRRQSRTWKGAIQQLGGEIYNTFSEGMQKALRPMTGFVTGKLIPAVNAIGKALKQIDWQKTLARPLAILGGLLGAFRLAADPSTRATGVKQLKGIVRDVAAIGKAALNGLGGIVRGLLRDGASVLEQFVTGGGVQAVLKTLFAGLTSVFRYGAALFKSMLSGVSDKFRSRLLSMLPGSAGDYERRKRSEMTAKTFAELFPGEAERIANDRSLTHWRDARGNLVPYSDNEIRKRQSDAVMEYVKGLTGSRRDRWETAFARNMGWDLGRKPSPIDYKDIFSPVKEAAGNVAAVVRGINITHTTDALKKALAGFTSPVSLVSSRLRRLDEMDDVQARRRQKYAETYAELSRLRRIGWDAKGRVRQDETPREAKARLKYAQMLRSWREWDGRMAAMLPQNGDQQPLQAAQNGRRAQNARRVQYQPLQRQNAQRREEDARKRAQEESDSNRREAAEKAAVKSAVTLDDIRRGIERLVSVLGQDYAVPNMGN